MERKFSENNLPSAIEDAEIWRGFLLAELHQITSQAYKTKLTDREREAYGVLLARQHEIQGELGFLKRWIKQERRKLPIASRNVSQQPTALLREAEAVIRRLQKAGARLEQDDIALLKAIEAYLTH